MHKRKEALTHNQQKELLSNLYVQNRDLYRKVAFLIETMCRVSEFAGLTWDDIDIEARIITIDHQMQYKNFDGGKARYRINPTKNAHTRKRVTCKAYSLSNAGFMRNVGFCRFMRSYKITGKISPKLTKL